MRFLLLFALLPFALMAQDEGIRYENYIYDEDIATVQFHLAGATQTNPMLDLRPSNGALVLEFDHLGGEIKDYLYTIQHCTSDWQPSDLVDNEYIDGYNEDRILEFQNSLNTLTPYVRYTLRLPNANMRWTKSGNYLLKIYDNDDDRRLVLTRRFLVVESLWGIDAQFVRPAKVDKFDTHHEIDFTINYRNFRIQNPQQDVKAYVMQNFRWDNIIGPLPPFAQRETKLVYDYQDRVVFPAGREWRFFDMRAFDSRGEGVKRISEKDDYYEVTLYTDQSRGTASYLFRADLNGRYAIDNRQYNQTIDECDYARVLFSLTQNQPIDDADVYVFGELSDWRLRPEFKMEYLAEAKAYVVEPLLKQGYYNYEYVVVDRKSGKIDESEFEGNWYETRNDYIILVYYRPFGDRYDRLMSSVTLVSGQK
ncbi:MAG: DUF5103 domain-containing protein [Saprospiraceae bacterium]|nr:DUF5103 domain-containing protein [Saprospiraceae bacterium]